jgi:RNA methyltransferase, TrmH family
MITSVHNVKVQAVRRLQAQARERQQQQAFVLEGVRLCEEALQAGWVASQVFFTDMLDERGKAVVGGFKQRDVPVEQLSPGVMQALSETETSQGLLVVVSQQILPLPSSPDFLLILDGLRDPGNLGTVLRTALAAGVQGVMLAPGCADAWSGKVVRSAMGAHFRLPIYHLRWSDIQGILKAPSASLKVFLADAAGGMLYSEANFHVPLAIIVGGEAAGAGAEAHSMADEKVYISMAGGSESLNAGVAASILLYEVVRQRRK